MRSKVPRGTKKRWLIVRTVKRGMYFTLAGLAEPGVKPALDGGFRPAILADREFRRLVRESDVGVSLVIGLERVDGTTSRFESGVFPTDHPMAELNLPYAERLVKFVLWQKGGWKVTIGGPKEIGRYIRKMYSPTGAQAFDHDFHGKTVSERNLEVVVTDADKVPPAHETSIALGRHLEGYRIGFDLGASDRKAAAVVNGKMVWSEEVDWDPRGNSNPAYHYAEISAALKNASSHMPRVDAIGGSSAGVILRNQMMVASLFRGVPKDQFHMVKSIFLRLAEEWEVPFEVANDGDVTALAGAMSLDDDSVLGVAMGSSEAVGYVNEEGNITGWLNELAFAPIDYCPWAPADEWSGDIGCGVQYLTQQAVFRLAEANGISLAAYEQLADKLKHVQGLLESGNETARKIWETIGVYMGYAIAHYADFYKIKHMLILGRVTSGIGGSIILAKAQEVLNVEFLELASSIMLHLPDENTRRVGQAVAAASLPVIGKSG
ncbi:MAG: ROK family protein [Candidatus Berkelbacteria bacterium]|nr:ROK family protein [Candidatus Berkelbacteria bacterium]